MKAQLEKRLKQRRLEFENGQKKLTEFETQATNLRHTLLHISGAIQVLEEELAKFNEDNGKPTQQPDLKSVEEGN